VTVPTWVVCGLLRAYGNTCTYCGWQGEDDDFVPDHAIPKMLGGSDHAVNLRLACKGCNAQKGTRTEVEYRIWRMWNPDRANCGPFW